MPIELHEDGRVAIVVINRPEALNAFDSAHLRDFIAVVRDLSTNKEIRAVVLTGAGDRAFAAGADIRAMRHMNQESGREFGRLGHGAAYAVEALPQPVIAA